MTYNHYYFTDEMVTANWRTDLTFEVFITNPATPTPTANAIATQTATFTPTPMVSETATATPKATSSSAFPVNGVLDDFNRANGGIGGNWGGQAAQYAIQSNQLRDVSDGDIYWNAASFGANQEAYVTLGDLDSGVAEIDLILKSQSASWSGEGVLEVGYLPAGRERFRGNSLHVSCPLIITSHQASIRTHRIATRILFAVSTTVCKHTRDLKKIRVMMGWRKAFQTGCIPGQAKTR